VQAAKLANLLNGLSVAAAIAGCGLRCPRLFSLPLLLCAVRSDLRSCLPFAAKQESDGNNRGTVHADSEKASRSAETVTCRLRWLWRTLHTMPRC
jgi:hypothetical protein